MVIPRSGEILYNRETKLAFKLAKNTSDNEGTGSRLYGASLAHPYKTFQPRYLGGPRLVRGPNAWKMVDPKFQLGIEVTTVNSSSHETLRATSIHCHT